MSSVEKILNISRHAFHIFGALIVCLGAFVEVWVVGHVHKAIKSPFPNILTLTRAEKFFLTGILAIAGINFIIYCVFYGLERYNANKKKYIAYLSLRKRLFYVLLVIVVLVIGGMVLYKPILYKSPTDDNREVSTLANNSTTLRIPLAVFAVLNGSVFFIFKPRP